MPRSGTLPGSGIDSDEELMARYAAGDGEAFAALFGRFEPRAYRYFLKRTGSAARAEDLYQELFLRLHRARDRYDPVRPFTPWFFQIAHRLLVDDYRRAFRNHEVGLGKLDPCSGRPGAESRLADSEEVAGLLGQLSHDERYVLVAAKVEGVAYAEIGERLGKSAGAVRKMASRAMRRLRDHAIEDVGLAAVGR